MRILLVDDDQRVLQGLWRIIRGAKLPWRVRLALSGREALSILECEPVDLILADMQMPGMSGSELLATVAHQYPGIFRFSLSGHTDKGLVMRGVGLSHQFFGKPCPFEYLQTAVNRAKQVRDLLEERCQLEWITRLDSLPIMPTHHEELSLALGNRDVTMAEVAAGVGKDIGMVAKILHLANWGLFNEKQSTGSIEAAVRSLGLPFLRDLVLSTSLFQPVRQQESFAMMEEMHIRAYLRRQYAASAAEKAGLSPECAQEAESLAMLWEAGRLALLSTPDARAVSLLKSDSIEVVQARAGAALLSLWGLPAGMVEALGTMAGSPAASNLPLSDLFREYRMADGRSNPGGVS